jgi:hypothetical protein
MRSGKDTAVDYLINKYGGNKITFAKPLYDSLFYSQKLFNFEENKDRKYLQIVGDWARSIDKNVFVNIALNKVINKVINNENYFCNDLRFLNEFEELKKNNWICIKIIRNTNINDKHQSENELDFINDDLWNYIIYNDSTIENFYKQLENIIEQIIKQNRNKY